MSIYKAYDIRGIYNKEFDKETVYKIGFFLRRLFDAEKIAVCRDIRQSSDEIFNCLSKGIIDSGADVYDYGTATTPMSYYISFTKKFDTTVMITASHNPKEYNGFKISGPLATPVGKEEGLLKLKNLIENEKIIINEKKGKIIKDEIKNEYVNYIKSKLNDISNLKISIDCSSGSAALIVHDIFGKNANYILDEVDGEFKIHGPNPFEEANRELIVKEVKKNKSDIGIIFDGDADRVMFIDNKGRFVSPDLIINVLAYYLLKEKNEKVVIDIRSSKSCSDYIKSLGGIPIIWKVGHVFAKAKIKEENAIFGGELAGHYYFKEFGNCDSAFLATVYILNALSQFKRDNIYLADLIDEFSIYYHSGEINFKANNKDEIINEINNFYNNKNFYNFYDFDGIRYDFDDWWFNVRASNTEPYLRLVVEARTEKILKEKILELTNIIKKCINKI